MGAAVFCEPTNFAKLRSINPAKSEERVYEDRRLSSIAKNSGQDESVGSVEIFGFETHAKAKQM